MTKVPNILDHLDGWLARDDLRGADRLVLTTARQLCAMYLVHRCPDTGVPPSWPLNLDEWELWEGHDVPKDGGWWLLHTAEKLRCVRRRKARAEQVTLSGEEK